MRCVVAIALVLLGFFTLFFGHRQVTKGKAGKVIRFAFTLGLPFPAWLERFRLGYLKWFVVFLCFVVATVLLLNK